jgi:hypothetical protein
MPQTAAFFNDKIYYKPVGADIIRRQRKEKILVKGGI